MMRDLKTLIPYLKKYKNKLILGFIVVTISNLCSTYVPKVVGETIDKIGKGNVGINDIFTQIGIILILTFFSGLFMFYTRRTIIVASREIEYDLRKDLLDSVRNQSMNFFHKNPTGNLMAHASNDIPAAREFLGPAIMYSANTITTFTFALYFMLTLDPVISLVGLIPLPFIAYITYLIGQKIHIAFKDVQSQFADLTTQAQESISGVRVIRAYTREKYELNKFADMSKSYLKKNLRLARIESMFMPVLMVLVGISQIAVLAYGGLKVIEGHATLGQLTQFFIYLELLIWPVAAIGWITNLVQRGSASSLRLGALMDQKPEITDNNITNLTINEIKSGIEFRNVIFKYSEGLPLILNDISIKVDEGSTLGIVGSVGSGKTTFVNLIPRLFDINSGTIKIGGYDIKEIPLKELRRHIGIVPQEPFLFSDTIANNITFSKPGSSINDVIDIANKCRLHDEILSFENSYDTMLGERGITLSGGQKQRVAIARAMLKNPDILILDDALSAVDANTEEFVLNNLRDFMKDRTTVIISHRISTVKNADNIIFIENGKILEQGTHEHLIRLKGRYANMFKLQQIAAELEVL
jgi:ATP-binding cassette subfamily B protein